MKPDARGTLEERFWKYTYKTPNCWFFVSNDSKQHGRINKMGRAVLAHRVSWELHFGPIPDGMEVLHECDIKQCVNPEHLFLGTQKDNMADAGKKGFMARIQSRSETHRKAIGDGLRRAWAEGRRQMNNYGRDKLGRLLPSPKA